MAKDNRANVENLMRIALLTVPARDNRRKVRGYLAPCDANRSRTAMESTSPHFGNQISTSLSCFVMSSTPGSAQMLSRRTPSRTHCEFATSVTRHSTSRRVPSTGSTQARSDRVDRALSRPCLLEPHVQRRRPLSALNRRWPFLGADIRIRLS